MNLDSSNLGFLGLTCGVFPPQITDDSILILDADRDEGQSRVLTHIHRRNQTGLALVITYSYGEVHAMVEPVPPLDGMFLGGDGAADSATKTVPYREEQNMLPGIVRSAIARVTDIDEALDLDSAEVRLDALGIDSLGSMELVQVLAQETRLPIFSDTFRGCTTLRDITRKLGLLFFAAKSFDGGNLDRQTRRWALPSRPVKDVHFALFVVPENTSILQIVEGQGRWQGIDSASPVPAESETDLGEERTAVFPIGAGRKLKVSLLTSPESGRKTVRLEVRYFI